MKYRTLPAELTESCIVSDPIGTVRRVKHKRVEDGGVCTRDDQDAALSIRRTVDGWLYKCFRCGFRGAVNLDKTSPAHVMEMLRNRPEPSINLSSSAELPSDLIDIFNRGAAVTNKDCPNVAREVLLRNRVDFQMAFLHRIKYSTSFHRVIFPIYDTPVIRYMNSGDKERPYGGVVGWAGRNPFFCKGGAEPKWLIRKSENMSKPIYHLVGTTEAATKYCIIVEDAISAIRIYNALGCRIDVIALLGHELPTALIIAIKNVIRGRAIIWLDHDVGAETLKFWKQCNTLGLAATYINTTLDPKGYSDTQIIELFNKSKGEHEKNSGENTRCAVY